MQSIAWWPVVIVLIIATISDLRTRRIPNWLVLPFLASGLVLSGLTGGWAGLADSLGGVAVAAGLVGVFCLLRGTGAGDLKLCAAIGAWIGPWQLVLALVATAIVGGVLAVIYALWHRSLGRSLDGASDLVAGWFRRGLRPHPELNLDNPAALKMPYALAITIGTIFSFYTV